VTEAGPYSNPYSIPLPREATFFDGHTFYGFWLRPHRRQQARLVAVSSHLLRLGNPEQGHHGIQRRIIGADRKERLLV
jgi:hypothetical protein